MTKTVRFTLQTIAGLVIAGLYFLPIMPHNIMSWGYDEATGVEVTEHVRTYMSLYTYYGDPFFHILLIAGFILTLAAVYVNFRILCKLQPETSVSDNKTEGDNTSPNPANISEWLHRQDRGTLLLMGAVCYFALMYLIAYACGGWTA